MQFTFKRDEKGRERIYVGDVCVWQCNGDLRCNTGRGMATMNAVRAEHVGDAIERADEAGFWHYGDHGGGYNHDEVTVDVPVAETSTTLVVVREGE